MKKDRSAQEDKIKKIVKEAVSEVLLDNDAMVEIIKSVTNHAVKKQAGLLREALDIIEEKLEEVDESIERKIDDHMERLTESIVSSGGLVTESFGDSDDDVHRQFAINARRQKGVQVQEDETISLRRKPKQQRSRQNSLQEKVTSKVKNALGIDVFADIDTASAMENHVDPTREMAMMQHATPVSYDETNIEVPEGQSYSISAEDLADLESLI